MIRKDDYITIKDYNLGEVIEDIKEFIVTKEMVETENNRYVIIKRSKGETKNECSKSVKHYRQIDP